MITSPPLLFASQEKIASLDNGLQALILKSFNLGILQGEVKKNAVVDFINDRALEMIGYTREQYAKELHNKIINFTFSEDHMLVYKNIKHLALSNDPIHFKIRAQRRKGEIFWLIGTAIAFTNEKNQRIATYTFFDLASFTYNDEDKKIVQNKSDAYELAMASSDITLFEYNILTKQLILPNIDTKKFQVSNVVDDAVETFIKTGIIEPSSAGRFRELYRKIESGAPFAQAVIHAKDANGAIHEYNISLTNVFDQNALPVRAIGVRRNITQIRQLQKEKDFGETLISNKFFLAEINSSQDKILYLDETWQKSLELPFGDSFSKMIHEVCKKVVHPDDQKMLLSYLSPEYIFNTFKSGQRLIVFNYRKKINTPNYHWCEATLIIIKDEISKALIIRFYIADIQDQKEKEEKALGEHHFYKNMLAKSLIAYEINITQNKIISGHENWETLFGITPSGSYDDLLMKLCTLAIHPEDHHKFCQLFLKASVLQAFKNGENTLTYDYRRFNKSDDYLWVTCSLHLFEDPISNDLKGYSYIQNIDEKKKEELALIYKSEHDLLTGLYNKATVQKYTDQFLETSEAQLKHHAFFIIDIDHFKSINDNFGHAFGDVVLSQTAVKIKDLFRDHDLVGRIGGDEFIVLMKNIPNSKIVLSKAGELCQSLPETYVQNGHNFRISGSIGIAIFDNHGKTYDDLYQHSDSALYVSKRKGRDQFSIYNTQMEMIPSQINEITAMDYLEVKNFENNISDYIFRILYEAKDKVAGVNAVLSLIGRHFNVSRVYVFESSGASLEWHDKKIATQTNKTSSLIRSELKDYALNFNELGIFYLSKTDQAPSHLKKILKHQGIQSMVQFSMKKNGQFAGFIGFDECRYPRIFSNQEITDCLKITHILEVFMMGIWQNP